MKVKVTKDGVLVPKALLGDVEEVEITGGDGHVSIRPALSVSNDGFDASLEAFGRDPARTGIADGSVNHDRYIYDDAA